MVKQELLDPTQNDEVIIYEQGHLFDQEPLTLVNINLNIIYNMDPNRFGFHSLIFQSSEEHLTNEIELPDEQNVAMLDELYELLHARPDNDRTELFFSDKEIQSKRYYQSPDGLVFIESYTTTIDWSCFKVMVFTRDAISNR